MLLRAIRYIYSGVPNKVTNVSITTISPNNVLNGKVVFITGGGRGIGYNIAKKCKNEGANVIIAGRDESVLINSAKSLDCQYVIIDVQNIDSINKAFIESEKYYGPIDCLINNSGISLHEKSFLDVTLDQFDKQINTNFRGAFFVTQIFIKRYLFHKISEGNIIFISSETSITPDERPYGLTKAAVNSLAQGLAYRYIKSGIRVNVIAPGITVSGMTSLSKSDNLYREAAITHRIYLPEEIAEITAFLLSDNSKILNGQILLCNEGKTIDARIRYSTLHFD